MMLRISYQTLLDEIIEQSPIFERKDFTFIRTQYYIEVLYQQQSIAVISSLNDATELKYSSNFLKKYPIMVYDEFFALQNDYLPDEWEHRSEEHTSELQSRIDLVCRLLLEY